MYSLINNSIYQTPNQDNNNLTSVLIPLNIKKTHLLSFSSNLSFDFYNWWYFNINTAAFYNKIESNDDLINIDSNNLSTQITVTNSFSLPKKIKFELSMEYNSPFTQGPYKTNNLFYLNMGISKSLLNNNMKISITGNDILKTYKFDNKSIITDQKSRIKQNFDTQWFRLNVIYKLNRGVKKDNSANDKIFEELKSRVK